MRRPSLTAYKPTVRDMVARQALNLFGDTYANRKFARNMFGSSGLGSTGEMSVADFTPAGVGFAADEAGRQAGQGHPFAAVGNLALAALPIPGRKAVVTAGRAVAGKAKGMIGKGLREAAEAAPPGITAYHGSPHTFDQFSLDKIGTGEGAQAYGHGLYFAENEGVAKNYRDALALPQLERSTGFPEIDRELLHTYGGDWESFKAAHPDPPTSLRWQIEDIEAEGVPGAKSPGSMYQVRINADPNDFLDWDAPLSGQSEKVRESALGLLRQRGLEPVDAAGEGWLTGSRVNKLLADQTPTGSRTQTTSADAMREAGIPGIKYLDQGSRGAGEGSRNFVVFDPKIIDIMKRYGVAAPVAAAILAGTAPRPAEAKDQPNLFRGIE